MPVNHTVSLSKLEEDSRSDELYNSLIAKTQDVEKTGATAPWRKHFRASMSMCIG
jgi:hypothetical protein